MLYLLFTKHQILYTMKIKTLIIDDEKLAREELAFLLKDFSDIDVLDEAKNVKEAIIKIDELRPDLIFLDINMPEHNGFELLERLDYVPNVIFVTAYDHFAVQAFETDALAYLVKPVLTEKLAKAIETVKQEIQTHKEIELRKKDSNIPTDSRVFIKDGERCYFVKLNEIFLIESISNYCKIYFDNKMPLLHRSLQKVEERLPTAEFFKANRAQIININYITHIESLYKGGMVVEINKKHKVEISQRQAVLFKELMSL